MGKSLYLECYAGVSGRMIVEALLELGADRAVLDQALNRFLQGENRSFLEVLSIIEETDMTRAAKETAKRIFSIWAESTKRVKGTEPCQKEFDKETDGNVIREIVGAAVCLDQLGITQVVVPRLYEGYGMVSCDEEVLPVPVPVVADILSVHDLPVEITSVQGQLITPVGAAIVAGVRTGKDLPQGMRIQKIGVGRREEGSDKKGVLRALVIESDQLDRDMIVKLETNIDDCTGEGLGYVMERLFEAGARDVHFIPVFMKKNRPAYQLNVLCTEEDVSEMERIMFEETTTIGVRRVKMERTVLKRQARIMETSLGPVKVKVCQLSSGIRLYPEFESVKKICEKNCLSFQEVYERIRGECQTDTRI